MHGRADDARRVLGRLGDRRVAVPVHPDRHDRDLRVRPFERAELADPALHDEVVLGRVARRAGARRAEALVEGRPRRRRSSRSSSGRSRRSRCTGSSFFGREAISLLLVLPLALPGIITGIALQSFFNFNGINLSLTTIVIGHTTFCIVVIYNNVLARLRRTSSSLNEASADLGAHRLADVPLRHAADAVDRAHRRARCSRSRCRSTR